LIPTNVSSKRAGRKLTIFYLDETSKMHKRLPKHKLSLKPHEVASKAEAGVKPMLEEVQEVVAKDEEVKVDQEAEEEVSLLIGERETLLEQDEEAEGPRLHKTGMCGFTWCNIYARRICYLLAFLFFLRSDVKKTQTLSQIRTSVQQQRRAPST
jgi:hypothetical protein